MKKIILLFITLTFLTSCDTTQKIPLESVKLQYGESIENKYNLLKSKIEMGEGGISVQPYTYQYGTLYSTYFIYKSLVALDYQFDNKEKYEIANFINKELDELINNDNNVSLIYDLYYAYITLELIDPKSINKDKFKSILDRLYLNDGSYKSSLEEEDSIADNLRIVSTYMAVEIDSKINKKINTEKTEATIEWINEQLKYKVEENYNSFIHLYKAMEILEEKKNFPEEIYTIIIEKMNELDGLTLFDIELYGNLMEYTRKSNESLENKLSDYIISKQTKDGGWNVFLDSSTDEQGISIALNYLTSRNISIPQNTKILNLLKGQKSIDGGYSPIFEKEFSLENTFFVNNLDNFFYSKENLVSFSNEKKAIENYEEVKGNIDLYYLVFLSKKYDLELDVYKKYSENSLKKFSGKSPIDTTELLDVFYSLKSIELISPEQLTKYSYRSIWKSNNQKLNFQESLIFLNMLKLTNELELRDVENFVENFRNELKETNDAYVTWLCSNILGEYKVQIPELFEILSISFEKQMQNLSEKEIPISLDKAYYLMESYVMLNEGRSEK